MRLRKAAQAVAGSKPAPGLEPEAQNVRSASFVLPLDGKFKEMALEA